MAGSFSDYMEDALLDHVCLNAPFSQPAHLYVALYTVAPTDAGGGTEVSGGAYARTMHDDWDAASGGATSNDGDVTFAKATANWGTLVAFGVFDAATVGNLLWWSDLTVPKLIEVDDTAVFEDGDLQLALN